VRGHGSGAAVAGEGGPAASRFWRCQMTAHTGPCWSARASGGGAETLSSRPPGTAATRARFDAGIDDREEPISVDGRRQRIIHSSEYKSSGGPEGHGYLASLYDGRTLALIHGIFDSKCGERLPSLPEDREPALNCQAKHASLDQP
jgi:hypothetical protein